MSRWLTISLALCSCGALAQTPDFDKAVVKVSKVAGSVYLLKSETGCNIAASVGEDRVLLVHASYRQMLDKNLAALRQITAKPVNVVGNTRCHGDRCRNRRFPNSRSNVN